MQQESISSTSHFDYYSWSLISRTTFWISTRSRHGAFSDDKTGHAQAPWVVDPASLRGGQPDRRWASPLRGWNEEGNRRGVASTLEGGGGKNPTCERATAAAMSDPLHGGLQTGPASRLFSNPGTVININCLLWQLFPPLSGRVSTEI